MSDEQARIAELERNIRILEAEIRWLRSLADEPDELGAAAHTIAELERELSVVRANHAAASERARNTCACKFDDDGNEPVRQCDYHVTQARDLAAARERIAEMERDCGLAKEYIGALSFALSGIHPCGTDNEAIDELVAKALAFQRDLAAARERLDTLSGDLTVALNQVDDLRAENARLRRALDAAGLVRLLQWAQERLEHWTEYTANSPVWDEDEPEDAEQMDQDRRALVAIKSALAGLVLGSDPLEEGRMFCSCCGGRGKAQDCPLCRMRSDPTAPREAVEREGVEREEVQGG